MTTITTTMPPLTLLLSPANSFFETGYSDVPLLDLDEILEQIPSSEIDSKDYYRNFDRDPVMSEYGGTPPPMTSSSEDSLASIMDFSQGVNNTGTASSSMDFAMEAAIAIRALATPPRSKTPTESFTSTGEQQRKEAMIMDMEDVEMQMCDESFDVGLLSPVEMSPFKTITRVVEEAPRPVTKQPTFDLETAFRLARMENAKATTKSRPRKVLAPRGPNTSYRSMPYYQTGRNLRSGVFGKKERRSGIK